MTTPAIPLVNKGNNRLLLRFKYLICPPFSTLRSHSGQFATAPNFQRFAKSGRSSHSASFSYRLNFLLSTC